MKTSRQADTEIGTTPTHPVRYILYIAAKNDEGVPTGESIHFLVDALALPRVGDRLHFAAGRTPLYLTVREIDHWFFTDDEGSDPCELAVHADPDADEAQLLAVRKLLNREERQRWIAQFSMLGYLD